MRQNWMFHSMLVGPIWFVWILLASSWSPAAEMCVIKWCMAVVPCKLVSVMRHCLNLTWDTLVFLTTWDKTEGRGLTSLYMRCHHTIAQYTMAFAWIIHTFWITSRIYGRQAGFSAWNCTVCVSKSLSVRVLQVSAAASLSSNSMT